VRIRSVKPDFWQSLTVAELSLPARLLFIGLWNYCDDEGRAIDDARLIRGHLFPFDHEVGLDDVSSWLEEISRAQLIVRYQAAGRPLLAVRSWGEHQHPQRPRASRWPAPPPVTDRSATAQRLFPEGSLPEVEVGSGKWDREVGLGSGSSTKAARPKDAAAAIEESTDVERLEQALGSGTAVHNLLWIADQDPRWLEIRPSHVAALNGGGAEPWRRRLVAEALSRLRSAPPADWTAIEDPAAYLTAMVDEIEREAVEIHGGEEST